MDIHKDFVSVLRGVKWIIPEKEAWDLAEEMLKARIEALKCVPPKEKLIERDCDLLRVLHRNPRG